MENAWSLKEAVNHFTEQGAPENQPALVELFREVQRENGGAIPSDSLSYIAEKMEIKESFISAIIKRYPSLRTEAAPNLLELCGGERCRKRASHELRRWIERTYRVKPDGMSGTGKFKYKITGCMKNCPKGPSIKWNGTLYSNADQELITKLAPPKYQ